MTNPERRADKAPRVVVFDVGGVLIDWNPEYLYRKLIPDDAARAHFLTHVTPFLWNAQQDLGLRTWPEAIAHRASLYPEHEGLIRPYFERWSEMVSGGIQGTVAIKAALRARGVPTYAITNFACETWEVAQGLYPFLREFDGEIVSGREKMLKPDPAIYRLLCARFSLEPKTCLFIDDVPANVEGARAAGMQAHHFTEPEGLARLLAGYGLLPDAVTD